ncbi:MAG: cytochrome C oxidase subunit IV family protein [Verrucomicrobiota bacterium]|nr:cytochrome C oxidase subunit IV family protein [Verrucomicrobiota bacterium]
MSNHDAADVQKSVKRYLLVFGALIAGTIITVAVNYLHLDSVKLTIAIALFIASVKAFLVAGYFMHLISERKMIYGILAATVFFFAGLMFLTVWSMEPKNIIHIQHHVP